MRYKKAVVLVFVVLDVIMAALILWNMTGAAEYASCILRDLIIESVK